MQPTNKHLRISCIHEVNNNMTQLLSMSHTFKPHQMHWSISNYNTHCRMTYGCHSCSLAMIGFLQVEYSSWWLALISLTFNTYRLLQWVHTKPTPPHIWVNGKKGKLPLRLGVYIGVYTYGKFFKPCFYHVLEMWVTAITMVILLHSSTSLLPFHHGKYDHFPRMYI